MIIWCFASNLIHDGLHIPLIRNAVHSQHAKSQSFQKIRYILMCLIFLVFIYLASECLFMCVFWSVYLSFDLSVCLSAELSVFLCMSSRLFASRSVHLYVFFYLSSYRYIYLSVCLFVSLAIGLLVFLSLLSLFPSVCMPFCIFVSLFVCLYFHLSVRLPVYIFSLELTFTWLILSEFRKMKCPKRQKNSRVICLHIIEIKSAS